MNRFPALVEFLELKKEVRRSNLILLVGIDISKRTHVCSFEMSSGEVIRKRFCFSNDIAGFSQLIEKIRYYQAKLNIEEVVCGLEATATYWKPLAFHLFTENVKVVLVSTLAVKKNRQTIDVSKDKNDVKDAHNICDLMAQGKFQYLNLRKGRIADLCRLFRIRFGLIKEKAKKRIKFRQILDEIFPEIEAYFNNILGATILGILKTCPFPQDIVNMGIEQLMDIIKKASRNRLGREKALTIFALAQRSIGIDIEQRSVRFELQLQIQELQRLLEQIEMVENEIKNIIAHNKHYKRLLSIKGIGLVTAAGLIGEIGDIQWYSNAKQLTKLAGLDLWSNDSGDSIRSGKHISKKGRKYLRTIAYEAAVNCVRCNSNFKQKYLQLLDNQSKKKKIKAIAYIAIADKILRLVFRMLKDATAYDPDYDQKLKERYRCKKNKTHKMN